MTQNEFWFLEDLCSLSTPKLFNAVKEHLHLYNFNAYSGGKNHFIAWGSDIMLVAHIDTVFKRPPEQLFYDKQKDVILALGDGAGFDDRAGVYAILEVLKRVTNLGLPLPTVLFTLGEEDFGIGAQEAGSQYKDTGKKFKYMIELDRAGKDDCVFYQCENQEFKDYVASFDFKEQKGTYTDITFLMDDLQVCGVNLSIGYYEEHSRYESLRPSFLEFTICKVINMLSDAKNAKYFEYCAQSKNINQCDRCGFVSNDLIDINTMEGQKRYCIGCILSVGQYCRKCKNLFDKEETDICSACGEEN